VRHLRLPTAPPILLVSLALIGFAGCAFEDEPPGALEEIAYNSCPDTGCGTNGSFVDGWAIGELDEGPSTSALAAMPFDESLEQSSQDNFAGVRLLHLRKNNHYYRADVEGHRLVALDHNGVVQLSAQDLEGSALVVELPGGERAFAHIVEFRRDLPFWISPDDTIEAFRIRWSYSPSYDSSAQDVCPSGTGDEEDDDTFYYATLFQGDRYDGDLKQVIATGHEAGTWFNVACFKSVASKMLFNRHAEAGLKEGYKATTDQKQALLKMMTADFCGKGKSFTKTGTPLAWTNSLGWQKLNLIEPVSYEAVWGPDGAICLDDARLGNEETILKECDLPPCDALFRLPTGWQKAGYLLSANP
jgi:hypothetical protein